MRALVISFTLVACAGGRSPTAPAPSLDATPAAPPAARVDPPTPALVGPMARLSYMRGVWVGTASGTARDGSRYQVTQTERMGPMLGGDVVVIEGRGYDADGRTAFNALGVVSYDAARGYQLRSYADGMAGTFDLALTDTGYVWEIPAGPDAVVRFTATVTGDQWHEVGAYVPKGAAPIPTFEMRLRRVGDTTWPLGTPVGPEVAGPGAVEAAK